MLAIVLIWLLVEALVLAGFVWMPVMRGEEAFFGVRVDSAFYRGEGRKLLHRYWFWLAMIFIEIEAIGIVVSRYRAELPLARIASMPLLVLPAVILYILYYRQVKPFAAADHERRFASSLIRRHLSDYTNFYLETLILLLTVAPSLLLIYYYPQLPEKLPVHWNWRGEPDGWARKSFGSLFFLSVLLAYMQGLFLLIKHGLLSVKMTLPVERTEEYLSGKEEFLRATMKLMDWVRILIATMLGSIILNLVFTSVAHLRFLVPLGAVATGLSACGLLVMTVYYIYRFIAIDRRLKRVAGRVYVQRERDAAHWYAGGLFYYNPDDPSLFIEKMVGFGYTFNMGNPWVYIYLVYMIGFPLIMSWGLKNL